MTNEELEREVKRLEEQITELRFKILESKGGLIPYKPYEVKVPEDIGDYYFLDETGNIVYKALYSSNYQKKTFIHGLAFKTKEEAERYEKERILLFKLHKWAEEHNGGWEDCEIKFYITYQIGYGVFDINWCVNYQQFTKLPYFKSEEIAQQFIKEFGEEIKEVLC